jgi:hypothetical protein
MMHAGASPHRYDASPKIIGELFRQTPRPLAIWPEIPGSSCERPRHIFYFNSACILQIAVTEAILSKWALEGKRAVKVAFLLAREGSSRNSLRGKTA